MNVVIFDTETTSLNKPFSYNIGYVIADDYGNTLLHKDFVIEQIWHNLPLFNTAYYADKRPIYVNAMRQRVTIMKKFGYVCQEMIRDFKMYNIELAFAYNSNFDEKVFEFNCDWFKCINPFDNIAIHDIRGFVHNFLVDNDYFAFCDKYELYTECGHYSTTAEVVYRYLCNNNEFIEDHTALSDALIETEILFACVIKGAKLKENYLTKRSIERKVAKKLHIKSVDKKDYYFDYENIKINKEKTEIVLK